MHRRLIDNTTSAKRCCGMFCHSFKRLRQSWGTVAGDGVQALTRRPSSFQTCSFGSMSGEIEGQTKHTILFCCIKFLVRLARSVGSLSCWSKHLPRGYWWHTNWRLTGRKTSLMYDCALTFRWKITSCVLSYSRHPIGCGLTQKIKKNVRCVTD